LFRLFDIWKPFPIGWLDARVPGGLGVMLDDVLAAGYSILLLLVVMPWM
jgi:phosphatidylglycerophosphatase A